MSSYSIVIPCYNEASNIEMLCQTIEKEMIRYSDYEILFIDDGSQDETLAKIKEQLANNSRMKYISFSRNFGLEAAFSAGFRYANKKWIIQLDGDLQSPPDEIHKLIEKANEGWDAVFAIRRARQDPTARKLASIAQQWIAINLLGIELPKGASVFRIVRSSVAKKVIGLRNTSKYFIASLPLVTSKYTFVETNHNPRQSGKTKWKLSQLLSHTMELYTGFSTAPLNWISSIAVLSMIFFLINFLFQGRVGSLVSLSEFLIQLVILLMAIIIPVYFKQVLRLNKDPHSYFIREANFPVLKEDRLFQYEHKNNDSH